MSTRTTLAFLATALLLAACNVPKKLEKANHRTYSKNGLVERTFTDDAGPHFTWVSDDLGNTDKPKLMLIHGVQSSSAMWAGNLPGLSKDFELIVPDLIGHGRSTKQWSGNSVDQQVAHLVLILDGLGVEEPVYVVGNSYGGAMAANFAEQHPDRTRALVIYDGPANAYTRSVADSAAQALGATDILDFFTSTGPEHDQRNLNAILYKPRKVPGFALRQTYKANASKRPVYKALLQDLVEREAQYAEKRYMWSMPAYVIWGEGDRLIPPLVAHGIMRINELPPDHLIMIAEAGHVANIEQRDIFEGHLKRILIDGPCVDDTRISEGPCTAEFDPYCACDGRTYPNRCAAWRAGVRLVSRGECGN